jgi:hypothetical protein
MLPVVLSDIYSTLYLRRKKYVWQGEVLSYQVAPDVLTKPVVTGTSR